MADKNTQDFRVAPLQVFRSKAIKSPPGTRCTQKLPRGEEMFYEPSYLKYWLLGGGAVTAALVAGILIGRFLLP